ncbi:hypothetical protein O1611_g9668 [Lasiodiplodia mahajangana]|uniref:Uncharacterized protein n=1 Tax=Lasiodiplodia mahajangana TaxID=1108764 RepID=A0ACC2J733_9PEZI|nr:hypothetical protein O1611_g9668 [Lasiodiplodia mahajangana]
MSITMPDGSQGTIVEFHKEFISRIDEIANKTFESEVFRPDVREMLTSNEKNVLKNMYTVHNSRATGLDDEAPVYPLYRSDGGKIPDFPTTIGAMKNITDSKVYEILGALSDVKVVGTPEDNRATLMAQTGLTPVQGGLKRQLERLLRGPLYHVVN